MTILTNKQSGSRLDELGERKDAHGLGKIGCQGPVVYEFAVNNFAVYLAIHLAIFISVHDIAAYYLAAYKFTSSSSWATSSWTTNSSIYRRMDRQSWV